MNEPLNNVGDIIIYQTEDGLTKINVKVENETVWLSQQQMAELFQSSRTNVVEHIKNIYEEGELLEIVTCRKFRQVRLEGNREVNREIPFYNLDMIISLGYRIKSGIATQFRIWATQRLKEYLIKGFTMDDERLKGNGGGNYWKELLDRACTISHIQAMEKATTEYRKYQNNTLSAVEREYLDTIKNNRKRGKEKHKEIMLFERIHNKARF